MIDWLITRAAECPAACVVGPESPVVTAGNACAFVFVSHGTAGARGNADP